MNQERWHQLETLYHDALEYPVSERLTFLREACTDDLWLLQEVETLLREETKGADFLAIPAMHVAAKLLAVDETSNPVPPTIGRYEILSRLGGGGMGIVYLASDLILRRRIAVKVLRPEILRNPEARARFLCEARAVAALSHSGIVSIYETGEHESLPYLAMEYLPGQSLNGEIAGAPLEIAVIFDYAIQMACALSHAHERGILHRDIKSSNVLVTPDRTVKLVDFGLARILESETSTELTTTGACVGTLQYTAPELLNGQPADQRTDVYSLGVVLYEMACGQLPYRDLSGASLIGAILRGDARAIRERNAAVPIPLGRVIEQAMSVRPDDRFANCGELLNALRGTAAEQASGKQAEPRRAGLRSRWLPVWAALLPLLLVAGFLVWRAPESTEPRRAVPLTTQPGVHRYPTFSPDGNHLAFTWTGVKQDNTDIYVQQVGAGSPLRLTQDPSTDYNPVWSPDGRWIAFLRLQSDGRSELRLIAPLGGPEHKIAQIRIPDFVTSPYLAWCPDGTCFVVTDSPGEGKPAALFAVSLETGEKTQLTRPQPPVTGDANPAVSPDGSWLVFRRNARGVYGELYRLALGRGLIAVGEPRRLTSETLDAGYPTWMADSKQIIFSARGSLWRLLVAAQSTPVRLPFVGEDGIMPAVSRPLTGQLPRLVYVRSFADQNIWRVETSAPGAPASSPPVVSIASTRGDTVAQLSPDGRRVAFQSDRSGQQEVWLADPDGSNAVQLTASIPGTATGAPRWSPDGERIVFNSDVEGQCDVYVIPAAGGKPRNVTSHPASDGFPSFSRDGEWVYFASNRTGKFQIWKMPESGGTAVQLTYNGGVFALESLDGAWIYYVQTGDTPSPLWRMLTSGGVPHKVLEGVIWAAFVVLQGGIYYIDGLSGEVSGMDPPSGESRLRYFDFATRRSTTVARNLGDVSSFPTVSPDGRKILFTRTDYSIDELMLVEKFR